MRRWKLMVLLVLIGWSIYIIETGCAGTRKQELGEIGVLVYVCEGCAGTGKQELWEQCATEMHQDCWGTEDVLDCGYEQYRACIDRS